MAAEEVMAVMMLESLDDASNPTCPGPVVVHQNGFIQCPVCGSCAENYHGPDAISACSVVLAETFPALVEGGLCRRCRVGL